MCKVYWNKIWKKQKDIQIKDFSDLDKLRNIVINVLNNKEEEK